MLKVKNKKAVAGLAKSAFRANKLRNLFAVIAIVLTTVLFTGLFTVTSSLLASMEESTMRQVGGSAHGTFKYINQEQFDRLKTHPSIRSIHYSVVLAIAENQELKKRPTEIRYISDDTQAWVSYAQPTTGRMPQRDDEIAIDTFALDRLGIPAELGQRVTLEYSLGDKKYSEAFTLVGFWEGDKLMQTGQAWLNRGYVEGQLAGYDPGEKGPFGTMQANVHFANSFNIAGKMEKVLADSGFTQGEIPIGVNWAYTGNSGTPELGTVMGGILAISMIVFCGYLIISNVFFISVAKDTRFYGLLKTIGTTGRQIRFIIRRQALLLCAIGVPLGMLAGYFTGAMLTPVILSILNTNVIKVSMNPVAFAASAAFAVLTVVISIMKPSKIAARVSPMEALRSSDGMVKTKRATKKSGGISLWRMAWGNIARNRKKAALVTISLSLSLILLNCAYALANSFDMDKYLSGMIGSDFALGDVSVFNVHLDYVEQGTLTADLRKTLGEMEGVEQLSNIYFSEPLADTDPRLADLAQRVKHAIADIPESWLQNLTQELGQPSVLQHIYGLDDSAFEKLTVHQGQIDLEKLKAGSYVVMAPYDDKGRVALYNVGDKVQVTNVAGEKKEYEVLAIASLPYNMSCQHSHPVMPQYFLPSSVYLQNIADREPMMTTLEVADDKEAAVESFLADYVANVDDSLQYKSKATLAAEYANTQRTYKSVGTVLSLLVAFIGIMNFVNTVVTSIMSRKRELAMLQSIGMTTRQMETMLIFEGLFYTALTAAFALTIGTALGMLGVGAMTGTSAYFILHFSIWPALLCLPILAAVSACVPYCSQRVINHSSVVERLREAE